MTQPGPRLAQTGAAEAPTAEGASRVTTTTFRGQPPTRQRVADHVFDSLARAILGGELKPGEPVPTQRDLARQFNVSALVVRQAIHRLEDLKLVRVRQGSATIVLDPNESSDIRLVQLQMELAEPGAALALSAWENQMLYVVPLLVLAERRITEAELDELRRLLDGVPDDVTPADTQRIRLQYWGIVAKATRNPLFQQQVRWWSALSSELGTGAAGQRAPSTQRQLELHKRLIDALAARKGAVQLYLDTIRPLLDWMDAAREKAAARAAAKVAAPLSK